MAKELSVRNVPLRVFTHKLQERSPFVLTRYGDGEWQSILGYEGSTQVVDRQMYTQALREALRETLLQPFVLPDFYYGISPMALRGTRDGEINGYLAEHEIELDWVNSQIMTFALRDGDPAIKTFLRVLFQRRVLYVGPRFLRDYMWRRRVNGFIEVPPRDAFRACDKLFEETLDAIKITAPDVIGFSAGATSNVLIYMLRDLVDLHGGLTLIDFGSLFDPLAGKMTRKWHEEAAKHLGAGV